MEQTLGAPIDFDAPWRKATVLIGALAAVELVMLVLLAGALLAKPTVEGATGKKAVAAKKARTPEKATTPVESTAAPVEPAQQPRRKVSVLVLNGNGIQGAAASYAARVDRKGYRIGGVANAPTSDYTRTLVMYRPGFAGEGRRLARDLGIAIVGPLDGMRASQLHGAHAVVVIGA